MEAKLTKPADYLGNHDIVIEFDGAPVAQKFGERYIVLDGIAFYNGKRYRVHFWASRSGHPVREDSVMLNYLGKRSGAPVQSSHLTALWIAAREAWAAICKDEIRPALRREAGPLPINEAKAESNRRLAAACERGDCEPDELSSDQVEYAAAPIKLAPKPVQTIDLTPTWLEMVNVIALLIESGDAKGRANGFTELRRMAALADERNEFAARFKPMEDYHMITGRSIDGTLYYSGQGWDCGPIGALVMTKADAETIAARLEAREAPTRSPDNGVYQIKAVEWKGPTLWTLADEDEADAINNQLESLYGHLFNEESN